MRKHGLRAKESGNESKARERQWGSQLLLTLLLLGLVKRHQRFVDFYNMRSTPMNDYLKECMAMEREHLADIVSIVNYMV